MNEDQHHLVLEQLAATDLDLDRMDAKLNETFDRLGRLEVGLEDLRQTRLKHATDIAALTSRVDGLDGAVLQIKYQLELND